MKLINKFIYSSIVSIAILISSKFITIIPCRTAPNVPNPIYKWELCSLTPDKTTTLYSIKEYFGYTSSSSDAYLVTLFITFIVAMIFFHYVTRKNKKD